MYSSGGFSAYMTDYKPFIKDSVPYFNIKIKVVDNGPFQTFLDTIDEIPDPEVRKVSKYFQGEVTFDSIEFKKLGIPTEVTIDQNDTFDAVLNSIKCSCKKAGSDYTYTYIIVITKEVSNDNLDSVLLSSYLNATETDDNGKERKKQLQFNFSYIS